MVLFLVSEAIGTVAVSASGMASEGAGVVLAAEAGVADAMVLLPGLLGVAPSPCHVMYSAGTLFSDLPPTMYLTVRQPLFRSTDLILAGPPSWLWPGSVRGSTVTTSLILGSWSCRSGVQKAIAGVDKLWQQQDSSDFNDNDDGDDAATMTHADLALEAFRDDND